MKYEREKKFIQKMSSNHELVVVVGVEGQVEGQVEEQVEGQVEIVVVVVVEVLVVEVEVGEGRTGEQW